MASSSTNAVSTSSVARACSGCEHNLESLYKIKQNREVLYKFLIDHGVVPEKVVCETCGQNATFNLEKLHFRCGRQRVEKLYGGKKKKKWSCNFYRSARKDTWFTKSDLPLETIFNFTFLWLNLSGPRQEFLVKEMQISAHTVVDWSSFCREVCINWAERNSSVLGGPNCIVEVYETKIDKQKYERGPEVEEEWVLGGIEKDTGNCFFVPVPDRTDYALLALVRQWIRPGTTIMSNCWRSYDSLEKAGYRHLTVNYSKKFVDPTTGADTQTTEGLWRDVEGRLARFGRRGDMVGHLAEYMFRRKFPDHTKRVHTFFCEISVCYPPPQ